MACMAGELDLLFPFAPLGLEGFCVRCAVQTKVAFAHGVGLLSPVVASLVSIAGGAELE